MGAIIALVLATSVSASAASGDALSIIKAKTGKDAVQVTGAQSVDGLSVGVGHDNSGKALPSFVQTTANSVRMMAIISDTSKSSVNYSLNLPAGAGLVPRPDGSLAISREIVGPDPIAGIFRTEEFGTIAAPWASDANGVALATSYSYANGVLTQSIDTTGAVFPVVADPWMTSGWYLYVHFSRAETIALYRSWRDGGTPKEVGYLCALMLLIPAVGVIMVGLCSFYVYRVIADINQTITYCNAAFHRRLVIKMLPVGPFYYTGSYCEYSP